MKTQFLSSLVLTALILTSIACAPQKNFYWGSYEDSLFSRQQQAGTGGEVEAAAMLISTINEAQSNGTQKVGPGIHADYGYLLFKQGKPDEAIMELQKEASLYPESKPLMDTMITRIQGRKVKDKEKTPAP
ncbi:MAG: DUF4810 domain-containing protein [Nitrospiraceae bacterium]|jgi:hypothetical protein|nr:DUF4810 domain-containing protein [Nitrospiraceae bacterium]